MSFAPVAVFAFKRPEHTATLLRSLCANPEIGATDVYVFADGPRNGAEAAAVRDTRAVIRASGVPRLELIGADTNLGLAASVIKGVTHLCSARGRVIVLEDDLVVSPTFLAYMNAALDRYADAGNVFHISAYTYPVDLKAKTDAVFLPFIGSWGWATWQRAWSHFDASASGYTALRADSALRRRFDLDGTYYFYHMLEQQRAGTVDSWAIRWYLSIFMRSGLALFPARSLVQNTGFGFGATHLVGEPARHYLAKANALSPRNWPEPVLDNGAFRRVKRYLGWELSIPYRAARKGRRLLRRAVASIVSVARASK